MFFVAFFFVNVINVVRSICYKKINFLVFNLNEIKVKNIFYNVKNVYG